MGSKTSRAREARHTIVVCGDDAQMFAARMVRRQREAATDRPSSYPMDFAGEHPHDANLVVRSGMAEAATPSPADFVGLTEDGQRQFDCLTE